MWLFHKLQWYCVFRNRDIFQRGLVWLIFKSETRGQSAKETRRNKWWGNEKNLSKNCLINYNVVCFHRFREVLATNNIRPWELASVFKQILKDFLSQRGYDEEDDLSVQPVQFQPMEAWTSRYKMKQGFVTPTVPNCGDHPREEIPTVSGYVDRVMRHSGSFTAHRDWDLPYYYPVPLRSKGAYSTTLWKDNSLTICNQQHGDQIAICVLDIDISLALPKRGIALG